MKKIVPLHPVRHAWVKPREPSAAAGQRFSLLGSAEINLAAADFPLCFAKEADTGRFNLIALFGLAEPRNLFCLNGGWQATYLPAPAKTAPFMLDTAGACGLAIDEQAVELGRGGIRLFHDDGLATETATAMRLGLENVAGDVARAQGIVDAFAALGIIRRLGVRLRRDDGGFDEIEGLYTVGTEALATLADDLVLGLYRRGEIAAAATINASLAQFERLRQLHNASSDRKIAAVRVAIEN